jgi:hypothetical protein
MTQQHRAGLKDALRPDRRGGQHADERVAWDSSFGKRSMRTVNHYKALGILALGTLTAVAAAQNQRAKEWEPHQQGQGQGSHSSPTHAQAPTGPASTQHSAGPANPSTRPSARGGGYRASPSGPTGGGYHGNSAEQHGYGGGFGRGGMEPSHNHGPGGGYSPGQHSSFVTHTPNGMRTEQHFAGGRRMVEATRPWAGRGSGGGFGGTVHAVRYGNGVTGVVEHPLKPGFTSRTYVRGGRVLYAKVYSQHSYSRFGRTFTYQSVVPAVAFAPAYYAWAVQPWSTPVGYRWGWQRESWYAAYGDYFTPYPSYTSLDLWVTDYVVSQNMRAAYQDWHAETYPDTDATPDGSAPPPDAAASPSSSGTDAGSSDPSSSDSSDASSQTPPPQAAPPPMTPEVKDELNSQIKLQLRERQRQTTEVSDSGPNALKPGHKLFRVNAPLDVPSDTPGAVCSLAPNDYIERTGDMDNNGTVPVEVKLSAISDCGTGLVTRVAENDLEAMDSEQQDQLTQAMLVASKNMGPKGLPKAPGATPLLVAAGQARPDATAPNTLNQL